MLLFSERVSIAKKFREWANDRNALDCAENVLAYLSSIGALNEDVLERFSFEPDLDFNSYRIIQVPRNDGRK